jgi:hypothetical protein
MEAVLLGGPGAAPARAATSRPEPAAAAAAAAAERAPAPARPRPSGVKKPLRGLLFGVLGLLGFCLLAVILMGVFDICPPQGPWPQPPWCPGSPFQFSFGNAQAPTPSIAPTSTYAFSSGEYNPFGPILLEDAFDGKMLPRWQFGCDPHTTPWILDEIEGRTVLHSQPPSPPGNVSCAEIPNTDWQDYTIESNFKFQQPDQFGVHYFALAGRITHCPPTIQSVQEYSITVSDTGIQIVKSTCVPAVNFKMTEVLRPIDPASWHLLQYILAGNRIQVWLDGEQWLDYTDETDPIVKGGELWFSTFDSTEILIDDLKVYEAVPSESVPGPAPATAIPTIDAEAMMYGSTVLAAIQGREPNITDSFNQAGGWYGFTGKSSSPDMVSVQDGGIQARNDTTPGGVHMATATTQQLRNFVVMVEATFMESGSSPRDRAIGICWWPGDDLGDRFLLYESGRFEGSTCQAGECPTFVTGQLDPLAPGETVALTLISGLGKSGLLVNGTPLAYQKLEIQNSMSGFSLCPHEFDGQPSGIVYDNLRVWNLDLIPNLPLP